MFCECFVFGGTKTTVNDICIYDYECVFVLIFANLFMLRKFAKMAIEIPLPVISLNVIVN